MFDALKLRYGSVDAALANTLELTDGVAERLGAGLTEPA
jgi:hypothetical protein